MIRPKLQLLTQETVERVIAEAYELLQDPGVRIHSDEALDLLAGAGSVVDRDSRVASIPPDVVQQAVASVPASFYLHNSDGDPVVHYGDDDVQFDPGSAAIKILDPRPSPLTAFAMSSWRRCCRRLTR